MESILSLFINCMSLVLLWALWHFVWKPTSVNTFRQELFSVRDRLFLDASRDNIVHFDDTEYQELRMMLNYMIQYAHNASILRIVIFWIVSRIQCARAGIDYHLFFGKERLSMYRLTDPDKIKLRDEIMQGIGDAMISHLKRTSVAFWICVVFYSLRDHGRSLRSSIVRLSLRESRLAVDGGFVPAAA